ncbi:MAG: LPD38 domain-containing protein, partial [Burkholderiales bacterium]
AFALTGKQYSAKLAPDDSTIDQLRDAYGSIEPWWRSEFGHGFDGLTESEARYILKSGASPESLRDRVAAARPGGLDSGAGAAPGGANTEGLIRRSTERFADWQAPSASKFDDLVYKLQDKQVDTKRVIDAVASTGKAIADDLDVYLQEELYHGRAAKRTEDFVSTELEPLVKEMAAKDIKIDDLDQFLHARHAREANEVIARRNPEIQDGGSGMSNADADAYFAELPAGRRGDMEAAAARVDAILASTKQLFVDYELESAETVQGWGEMFKHYVPLMREDEGGGGGLGTGQGFSIKGREVKSRTGSTRKVVDILANIALQREKAIVRGEKNRVAQALVGLAESNENRDFWVVDEVPTSQGFNPATGLVEERADPMFKSRDNVLVAKIRSDDGAVRERAVIFNEKDERAVRMAGALKNLDAARLEGLLGVSAKVSRYFSAINTQYNPVFGVVNLVRDVQGALINLQTTPLAGKQAQVARGTIGAMRGIYGDLRAARNGKGASSAWAKLWEEFQQVGGQTGYRNQFADSKDRAAAIQRALDPHAWMESKLGRIFTANGTLKVPVAVAQKALGWMFDWLADYNEAMENGVRLSAYKAAIEHGLTKERAASLAKNLTVNFNRKGQAALQAGALYAFFNASVQGTARMGSVLFDMEAGKPKTLRLSKLGQRVVAGGMLLGSMQALALAAAGFGDDDPPDFVRDRSLIIPTGGKTYLAIPMPQGLSIIPSVGRATTEWALSGFKDPAKRGVKVFSLFADSFNPIGGAGLSMQTLAPTALDPLVALTENKDFTGRPIAKESSNKAIPGHALAKDTSTALSRMLSEAVNYLSGGNKYVAGALSPTPDQIDYLAGQVGGGVWREASKVWQAGGAVLSGEELPTHKIPLLGRFGGSTASQASEGSAFYANVERLNQLETEVKGLRKDGKDNQARELLMANPESYLITQANAAERAIQRLRRQKTEMVRADAPREQVRAQETKITEAMARLNRAVERLKERAPA